MSRELAIRVPFEIGGWVRQQPGSASETVLALAKDAWKRGRHIALADPGPGESRVKFRAAPRVLTFIRGATHSRDTTSAVRRLLAWGYGGGALPSARVAAPQPRVIGPQPILSPSPAALLHLTPRRLGRPGWMAYRAPGTSEERQEYRAFLTSNMDRYRRAESRRLSAIGAADDFVKVQPEVGLSTHGEDSFVMRHPWVLGLAVVAAAIFGVGMLGMLLFGFGKSATTAAAVAGATASAAGAVKSVAAWTPQAATGLGAMFL